MDNELKKYRITTCTIEVLFMLLSFIPITYIIGSCSQTNNSLCPITISNALFSTFCIAFMGYIYANKKIQILYFILVITMTFIFTSLVTYIINYNNYNLSALLCIIILMVVIILHVIQ